MRPHKSIDDFMKNINNKVHSLHLKRSVKNKSKPQSLANSPMKKIPKKPLTKTPSHPRNLDSTFLNKDSLQQFTTFSETIPLEKEIIKLKKKLKKANNLIKIYQGELLNAFEIIAELKGKAETGSSTKEIFSFCPEFRQNFHK